MRADPDLPLSFYEEARQKAWLLLAQTHVPRA